MNNHRIHSMLVLLLMGSASLMAQSTDDFGEVISSKYQNNMIITAHVCMSKLVNGKWTAVSDEVLGKETVVAAFCGDELRGKSKPADYNDKYFDLLVMTVYGNNKDKLHFKVLTDGRVIEVDQGITFKADDRIGKAKEPYYIYLPAPVTTTFSAEGWATTCLPFNARVPDGITLWNATDIENGNLVMEEVKASVLPKDTPVLLRGEDETTYEWLSAVIDAETLSAANEQWKMGNAQSSIFKGTTEPTEVAANSVLTLGHSKENGNIGFWLFTGTEIPANRAYIADFPTDSRGARIIIDDNTTTSISEKGIVAFIDHPSLNIDHYYDLQGRKINGQPMVNGQHSTPLKRIWKKNTKGQIIIIR